MENTRMRLLLSSLILAACVSTAWAADEPAPPASPAAPAKSIEQQLKEDPNSTAALNQYMISNLRQLSATMIAEPKKADEILKAMNETLNSLEPTADDAKQLLARAKDAVSFYEQRLEIARASMDDLKAKLAENPDDVKAIQTIIAKTTQELGPLASSEPQKAEEQLAKVQEFLNSLKEKATSEEAKKALEEKDRSFARLTDAIERAKRLAALIGSEAAPLSVEAWVNGDPLTDADLKGKVVLLDFWSVWCGPCISTFPHLREWQEKYADKGLVIIGLTRYYNYTWNAEAGRAVRSQEKVTPEQEQQMLLSFAEHYNLHHRFAIQKDSTMSEFYGVTGIPHVVVIDREGIVRLMRVGSGEQNAKDIEEMIEKLIAEGT
jgi:thiol-disulfide isomerase/thioredoxin